MHLFMHYLVPFTPFYPARITRAGKRCFYRQMDASRHVWRHLFGHLVGIPAQASTAQLAQTANMGVAGPRSDERLSGIVAGILHHQPRWRMARPSSQYHRRNHRYPDWTDNQKKDKG